MMSAWLMHAQAQPIAFAQVREDPRIDRYLVKRCAAERGAAVSVLQVASGGCTACLLAAMPEVDHLHLVDPNPAQMALTRVKLHLLSSQPEAYRMQLLGHAELPPARRAQALSGILQSCELAQDSLGPLSDVARRGPDFNGRYELLFSQLQRSLLPWAEPLLQLVNLDDPRRQQPLCSPQSALGAALDGAVTQTMALPHLVALFGASATGNAVLPFPEHFRERVRLVLGRLPASDNPYLWQLLLGRYPPGHPVDWLTLPQTSRLPPITCTLGTMAEALAAPARAYDLIHLSNILDWLTPAAATQLLELTWQALRPGGYVVIRQLNSSLDIPALGPRLTWDREQAPRLHHQDRSFFYRALHIGRRQ